MSKHANILFFVFIFIHQAVLASVSFFLLLQGALSSHVYYQPSPGQSQLLTDDRSSRCTVPRSVKRADEEYWKLMLFLEVYYYNPVLSSRI